MTTNPRTTAEENFFDDVATLLEAIALATTDIKNDINALKLRAEDETKGVVMNLATWYTDCSSGGNVNHKLQSASAVLALKRSGLLDDFLTELENPTEITLD